MRERDLRKHVNGEGVQKWKLSLIPANPGRVLDVGSGITEPYKPYFTSYVSVDLRPGAMVQADVLNLPFPDSAFDYCWCSELLEHLGGHDPALDALDEMIRVSKHGCASWPTPTHVNFHADPGHTDPKIEPSRLYKNMAILEW